MISVQQRKRESSSEIRSSVPKTVDSEAERVGGRAGQPSVEALVRVSSLCKSFRHGGQTIDVLKNIDLELFPGQMVSIVGRSGAGKSTLLHLLGALDHSTSGEIFFAQRSLTEMSARELATFRNRSIGFVFQFHHLLPDFDALENVMMPALIGRHRRAQAKEAAAELLGAVGLSDRLTHRPGELSGGEQQRVALARSLIMNPKIILADEPTGNLDSATGKAVQDLFFEINERLGVAMVLVTHNMDLAQRMSRLLTMSDGCIFEESHAQVSVKA